MMNKRMSIINKMKKGLSGSLAFAMIFSTQLVSLGDTQAEPLRPAVYSTIKNFEQVNPVLNIEVDAGTAWDSLNMPTSLRAVTEFAADNNAGGNENNSGVNAGQVNITAENSMLNGYEGYNPQNVTFTTDNLLIDGSAAVENMYGNISPTAINAGFLQTEPYTDADGAYDYLRYGYIAPENEAWLRENGQLVLYSVPGADAGASDGEYRVHGTYNNIGEGYYASDAHGNITGMVINVPISWDGAYDADIPGMYILTARFSQYNYGGETPTAIIKVNAATPEIGGPEIDGENSGVQDGGVPDGGVPDSGVPDGGVLDGSAIEDLALIDDDEIDPELDEDLLDLFGIENSPAYDDMFALMDGARSVGTTKGILSRLAAGERDSIHKIDGDDWVIVKKYPDSGPSSAVMIARRLGYTGRFGTNNTYAGSEIQSFFTNLYSGWTTLLKDVALVPTLGNNTSDSVTTSPFKSPENKMVLASSTTQTSDIIFAMSRQDMVDWNDGKTEGVRKAIRDNFPQGTSSGHIWLRTKGTGTTTAWELNNRAEGIGFIADAANVKAYEATRVPTVWVKVAEVWRYVNVHVVDVQGNLIVPPNPKKYNVNYDDGLTLTPDEFPIVSGYTFTGDWRLGTPKSADRSGQVSVMNIRKDTDIYLVYDKNSTASVVTVNYVNKVDGESIRTPDTYPAVVGTQFELNTIPEIPGYHFIDEWTEISIAPAILAPPVIVASVDMDTQIFLFYVYNEVVGPDKPGQKNAYINGASAPQNGTAQNPAPVKKGDTIRYEISTVNERFTGNKGAKYDVLFVLDWSDSMDAHMVPGQSARMYERDVMLDMNDFILEYYPDSRVAVMGMNSIQGHTNNPDHILIQYESDFLTADAYHNWGRMEMSNAFNIPPKNPTEDLVSFMKAANFKMEGQSVQFGSQSAGWSKTIGRDELGVRIPVIVFISDFQIPKNHNGGIYWPSYMKGQSDRFANSFPNGILQSVRFDHNGNHQGGNAVYSTSEYDRLNMDNFSPAGHNNWGFTRVDRYTPYTQALAIIKDDFMKMAPPGNDLGTIITDVVPEGLYVDAGSISHGGVYDETTRTITWNLQDQNEGPITVKFNAVVQQVPKDFVNAANIAFFDGVKIKTNSTYHRSETNAFVSLTISKTVTGDLANMKKEFEFSIYLIDALGPGVNAGKPFVYLGGVIYGSGASTPGNGVLTLSDDGMDRALIRLSHGQAITIFEIPVDTQVMIVETKDEYYDTSYYDSKDNIKVDSHIFPFQEIGDKDRAFDFTNARESKPPMGIDYGTRAREALPLLVALFILPGVLFVKFMRRRIYK